MEPRGLPRLRTTASAERQVGGFYVWIEGQICAELTITG